MKLLVEFETKDEMDAFFAASQQGALVPPSAIYIANGMPQSVGLRLKAKDDEPGAAVVELVMRGEDCDQHLAPGASFSIQ